MTSNLYKVGDWVYCEVSPFQPFVIRKIEELTKTPNGNVEAKVICAYRYHDIPATVMATVEKYKNDNKPTPSESQTNVSGGTKQEDQKPDTTATSGTATTEGSKPAATTDSYYEEAEVADLNEQQRYNLRHRELFFSKCTDTIAATTIRAKCSVLLFNEEIEKYSEYLGKEDQFYYHLTYDPYAKSLVADKGEIRVGMKYQAEVPPLKVLPNGTAVVDESSSQDGSSLSNTPSNDRVLRSQRGQQHQIEIPISQQGDEILNWLPLGTDKNSLTDADIDKYLTIAKSIGTFARALDCNTAFKIPSLQISAANASREITLFHAMNALHDNNYDIGKAVLSLVTSTGPVLCRDELEEWSAVEANLFEDALEKYGKEFAEIRKDYLPWKSMKSIIEYYYTWKTTDRYLQQKRIKLNEQESKLKQVYIPNHSKQNQSALIKTSHVQMFQQYDVHLRNSCESCGAPNTSTNQWYAYTPTTLVQLIMTGQTGNQAALMQAHAQALAQLAQSGTAQSTAIYQQRLCADCWSYWKKFSAFKFANAKQERLNQLKNQVHKCAVVGCGREFKMKQLLAKHCAIAHGYFTKANLPPGQQQQQAGSSRMPVRNRTAFHLLTTPMTRAARIVCPQIVRVKKLARRPFKLVDLGELNREWFKSDGKEPIQRNITEILNARAARRVDRLGKLKLDVKLINRIHKVARKSTSKAAKKGKVNGTNGTNGHQDGEVEMVDGEVDGQDDDDEDDDQLVIDYDNQEDRPEFFKYFGNKSNTPSFTPEQIAFPKPSSDQINKFHLNLMSQNRKRPLEGGAADGQSTPGSRQNGASDSENVPAIKRTLLANQSGNKPGVNAAASAAAGKQPTTTSTRLPQKSHRPTASSNLPNSPEDIFYLAVPSIKTLRREVEVLTIRRLARKPYRLLNADQHTKLYTTLEKIAKESLEKYKPKSTTTKLTNGCETTTTTTEGKEEGETEPSDEKKSEVNGTTHTTGSVVVLD